MRVALVCPDDLSVLLYCKSLIKALRRDRTNVIFTISPITEYQKEIQALDATHIPVEMSRYLNPLKDLRYFLRLYNFFRQERIEVVLNWTTKPNLYGPPAAWHWLPRPSRSTCALPAFWASPCQAWSRSCG